MTPTAALSSHAVVRTDVPARYAKQLVSHLGRKVDFVTDGATSTAQLGSATAQVVVGDGVLHLLAHGEDDAGARSGQLAGGRQPDAAVAAGDHDGPAGLGGDVCGAPGGHAPNVGTPRVGPRASAAAP